MFTAAMLENLPPKMQEFLAMMGLADEFTVEMAQAVTEMPDAVEILRTSLGSAELLERLGRCPVETLKRHPFAILVLMRCMFNWRQIPKMMELKELLLTTVAEHPEWSQEEKGNLLGECDLILSFLMYNDISAMSRLHRDGTLYFAVENNKGLFKGSGSDDVLREKFARQLKWCTDVMDVFAP